MRRRVSAVAAVMLIATVTLTGVSMPTSAVAVKKVSLNAKSIKLKVGETQKLSLKNATGKVTWKSSAKSVATVSGKGIVKGIAAGSARITAKNAGKSYTCKVKVTAGDQFKAVNTLTKGRFLNELIPIQLYFRGNGDIPYIALEDWGEGLTSLIGSILGDTEYNISCKTSGNKFSYVRENNYRATFDFSNNTLYFADIDSFFRKKGDSLASKESLFEDCSVLFRKTGDSFDRSGSDTLIDFNKYNIKIYAEGGHHFIPLQTFSDIFLARASSMTFLYNGVDAFLTFSESTLHDKTREDYYSAPKREMSKEFVEFNYHELCLGLDLMYGLKDSHGIKNFDTFFRDTGLSKLMLQKKNNATNVDTALKTMINYYLDDIHTRFGSGYSYNSDYNGDEEALKRFTSFPAGVSYNRFTTVLNDLTEAYKKYYPDGTKYYEEVGDTAYIKFDDFETAEDEAGINYQSVPTEAEIADDTIRLMQYACAQILRANSPIKRVVLDLSTNAGGQNNAAVYVIGTFLGQGSIAVKDVLTGAYSYANYEIDTNGDGVFDGKDTLANKGLKLYCITSNASFSCGNQVPCRFKDDSNVTLIGQTTGGGSCSVNFLSTASGSLFRVSGAWQNSFMKNGSVYDVDRGAEPDIYVKDISKLYDRKYMNTFLDKID